MSDYIHDGKVMESIPQQVEPVAPSPRNGYVNSVSGAFKWGLRIGGLIGLVAFILLLVQEDSWNRVEFLAVSIFWSISVILFLRLMIGLLSYFKPQSIALKKFLDFSRSVWAFTVGLSVGNLGAYLCIEFIYLEAHLFLGK